MSNRKDATESATSKEKKIESPFISFKRRTTPRNDAYPIIGSFKEIKKEKLAADIRNELDSQTTQFEHIFKSTRKAQEALPQSMYYTDNNKGKFRCPPQSIANISSSSSYRFLTQIPKPKKDYLVRYDKYPDMPSRIPKL